MIPWTLCVQIMLPTVVDHCDQMPEDLQKNWLAVVCPQGTRVLVIACHVSFRSMINSVQLQCFEDPDTWWMVFFFLSIVHQTLIWTTGSLMCI